jgi:hypothetical protein
LFVLNSNANDSLVAMLLTYSFLVLKSSRMRGATLALAGAAKFAPLALFPLFAGYSTRRRTLLRYSLAFAVVTLIVTAPVILGGDLDRFYDRTVGFQLGRDSPFSIWGQEEGLAFVQDLIKGLAVALAFFVAFVPRRKSQLQVAALGAAVLIAIELSLTHWFYLYIVWFTPFVLIALFGTLSFAEQADPAGGPIDDLSDRRHDELDRPRETALA